MKKKIKYTALFLLGVTSFNYLHAIKIVFPDKIYQDTEWTDSEKEKNIAFKNLNQNKQSSSHLVRIKGKEVPHYHDYHSSTVTVISGKSILHFEDLDIPLEKGDIVNIPKGTYHWAENIDENATVVFVTFFPAYKGKDKRLPKVAPKE